MAAKHKNPSHSAPVENKSGKEDENVFDHDIENEGAVRTPEKINELESSLSELKEKHLRLLAEFDNYKKGRCGSALTC
jgi:molecular chaperone GrpE (heat shock protein)